jgi:hypothetical protein
MMEGEGFSMKNAMLITAVLMITFSCGNREETGVQRCFNAYFDAIMNARGSDAFRWIDTNTKLYYNDILDKAVNLSAEETRKLSFSDKTNVLMARLRIPKKKLLDMRGDDFLIHAIDQGWVGKQSAAGLEIADIIVTGDMAVTKMKVGDALTPVGFRFNREGDVWKINLTEVMKYANLMMQKKAVEAGMNEDDFILSLLEQITGKKIHESIWEPVKQG